MKPVKLIGIMLIILMLLNIMPLNNVHADTQVNIKVKIYKDVLNRSLNLSYITPEIKKEIQDILNTQPKTPEEASNLISKAEDVLNSISKLAENKNDVGRMIEKSKLTAIINTLIDVAREANETQALNNLTYALKMVDKGDLEGAKSVLAVEMKDIEGVKMQKSSKALGKTIAGMLNNLSSNKTAVDSVLEAVSNVNMTINILENVKSRLVETNASENAIKALDRSIENLNATTEILKGVVKIVETAGVGEKTGNVTKSVSSSWVLDDVKDLRIDINKLFNETIVVEGNMNISLDDVRSILVNASDLLNQSEKLVKEGDVGKALDILSHVKIMIKSVEKTLDKYEKSLENSLREKGELKKYVTEKFKDLMERYNESLAEYKNLYDTASSLNATEALKHLTKANETLNGVSGIMMEIEMYINQSSYEDALKLINKAESKLSSLDEIFSRVKDTLKIVEKTVEEIFDKAGDLRDELNKLMEYANSTLSGVMLNKTIEKITFLENKLDEAVSLAENGSMEYAGMVIKDIKFKTENLSKCVEKIGDFSKEIQNLNETITEFTKNYNGSKEAMEKITKAMKLLNQTRSTCITAIENIDLNALENAENNLENIKNMLEGVTETHRIMFIAMDNMGRHIWNATMLFDGEEYPSGRVAFKYNGTYTLEAGVIPSGYTFSYWKAEGDVRIGNYTSESTNATVYGDCKVVMILNRTVSKEYTVRFYVKDVEGNVVENASIIFEDLEYYNANYTTVSMGKYTIEAGAIPDGYKFDHWMGEGGVVIKNPMSEEASIVIRGNSSITMVLSREVAETYKIIFHIKDESGEPVKNASIMFNDKEYYNGDSILKHIGEYMVTVGNIPSGYIFSHWESKDNITIIDVNSRSTAVYVNGSGDITLILNKKTTANATIKFYIVDKDGNIISNASIEFNGKIFYNGGNITVSVGVYIIKADVIPSGYIFSHWEAEDNATIVNSNSPVTNISISGDCAITLVIEKTSLGGS